MRVVLSVLGWGAALVVLAVLFAFILGIGSGLIGWRMQGGM